MESFRNLRFILAPSVLIGALLLAKVFECTLTNDLKPLQGLLGVLAGIVAASVVPAGFVIGGLTHWLLTKYAKCFPNKLGHAGRHEHLVGVEVVRTARGNLGVNEDVPSDGTEQLNAVRMFLYSPQVPKPVAEYVDRLWAASMAYAQSVVALAIAVLTAIFFPCIGIECSDAGAWWLIATVATGALFWCSSKSARDEIAAVVTYAVNHPLPPPLRGEALHQVQ